MRLVEFLDAGASLDAGAICLTEGDRHWTYGEAVDLSHRMARAFRGDGVVPGDRIGILAGNSAKGFTCILGLLRAEATLVALNSRNSPSDNSAHVRSCGITWLLHDDKAAGDAQQIRAECAGALRLLSIDADAGEPDSIDSWLSDVPSTPLQPLLPEPADGVWRLSLTGGTTGQPKRVEQTFRSAELTIATFLSLFHYDRRPTYLLAAPMTHAGGMFVFGYLAMGGRIVILSRPRPEDILDAIERERVNALFLPPTLL